MRITDIALNGFGIFHNLAVRDLCPGLTLFEGHNEAGKSTLMSFIRAVLFGFEGKKSGNNRYQPLHGGRHGGMLTLRAGDGMVYRVERYEGGAHGRITMADVEGRHYDEDLLQRLLYGTSKGLYQNVFAFGLTELQRLDTLQADEVSHHIYTAGMGTGSVPFAQVMAALEEEQGQLFKPGGKKPTINVLLSRLDHTQRLIRDLQTIPDDYYSLRDQIAVIEEEIHELQRLSEQAKQRVDWLGTALKARPDWEQLVTIRRELGEQPRIAAFPEGGVERLEEVERTLTGLASRKEETQRGIREVEERRERLQPNALLLQQQDKIQALAEDREHFRKTLENLPVLRTKVDSRRQALDDFLARLGPEWADHRLARVDASIPTRERIRGFRDRLAVVRQEAAEAAKHVEDAERARRAKEAEVDRLQRGLENLTLPATSSRPPVEEREKTLRQWVQHHHHRELFSQHRQDIRQLRQPLDEQIRAREAELRLQNRQKGLSLWPIIAVGLLLFPLAGIAVYLKQPLLGAALVITAIVIDGYLLWVRDRQRNERRARRDELRRQHQALTSRAHELRLEAEKTEREIEGCTERITTLSRFAVGHDLHSPVEAEEALHAIEAERRLIERGKELEARIQEEEEVLVKLLEEREAYDHALRAKEQACDEANDAWGSFLKAIDVGEHLTPDGALEVLVGVEGAKLQLRDWQESTQALERGEEHIGSMAQQINDVLEHCTWTPVALSDSAPTLIALRKALDESLHARLEFERLTDQLTEKRGELEALEAEWSRSLEQRHALLATAEAGDVEEFRRRAVLYKQLSELDRRQRQLEIALGVHAGSPERCRELEDLLATTSRAELERELAEVAVQERERLNEALTKKLQDKGRLEQQLHGLEQNERLSDTMLEYQTLLAQLDQHTQRWAIRRITQYLLDKARQTYERERQPAVLRQASEFFQVMTQDRYQRVIVPLGETRLEVESKDGRTQGTDRLSRGTAEQLYLSMRLAFVREYAKHAGPLPLVMDDILVNFDPERARAAIQVFKDIASTHQVLFFTCHPHVRHWFTECLPDLAVRSLSQTS